MRFLPVPRVPLRGDPPQRVDVPKDLDAIATPR
jgi:hypothetical protein